MKWTPNDASEALTEASMDARNRFVNQTLRTTKIGLGLAVEHNLGGRDALIVANFLGARISRFVTFDKALLTLGVVRYGRAAISIEPVKNFLSH